MVCVLRNVDIYYILILSMILSSYNYITTMSDSPTVICLKGKIHELGPNLEHAPNNYLYIGRRFTMGKWNLPGSIWANPYQIKKYGDATLPLYRNYILSNPSLLQLLPTLKGKILACWCHPDACHGDILVDLYKEHIK